MTKPKKRVANPWRGERVVTVGKRSTVLCVTMEGLARVFEITKSDTLEEVLLHLRSLSPDRLKPVFLELGDKHADEVWNELPGATGLNQALGAIIGAITGLTPEEEKEAEKKRETAETAHTQNMEERIAAAVIRNLIVRDSTEQALENGSG